MKKYIVMAAALLTLTAACTEEYVTSDIVQSVSMEPLQNVKCEPFVSSVILSWDIPANQQYYYTTVTYTDSKGVEQIKKISKFSKDPANPNRVRAVIGGFTDTNSYRFNLVACSYAGDQSTPVSVEGVPQDRSQGKDYVLSTVKFEPGEERAKVVWENDINSEVDLTVSWRNQRNVVKSVTFDAMTPHAEYLDSIPCEVDTEITVTATDRVSQTTTEEKKETIVALPNKYGVYNPAWSCFPVDNYGINMMNIEWLTEEKNYFRVTTSGGDPYIYTQLPSVPGSTTLVFQYRSEKNITGFELFLNGLAPGGDNEVIYVDNTPLNATKDGIYKGLQLTYGYWRTIRWDLSAECKSKFNFMSDEVNQRRIRIDFGGQNNRVLEFRNMHWE